MTNSKQARPPRPNVAAPRAAATTGRALTNPGALLERPVVPRLRCDSCGRLVSMLVDDGPLCIRCDSLFFPSA